MKNLNYIILLFCILLKCTIAFCSMEDALVSYRTSPEEAERIFLHLLQNKNTIGKYYLSNSEDPEMREHVTLAGPLSSEANTIARLYWKARDISLDWKPKISSKKGKKGKTKQNKLKRQDFVNLHFQGMIYEKMGDYANAILRYKRAWSEGENPFALAGLARLGYADTAKPTDAQFGRALCGYESTYNIEDDLYCLIKPDDESNSHRNKVFKEYYGDLADETTFKGDRLQYKCYYAWINRQDVTGCQRLAGCLKALGEPTLAQKYLDIACELNPLTDALKGNFLKKQADFEAKQTKLIHEIDFLKNELARRKGPRSIEELDEALHTVVFNNLQKAVLLGNRYFSHICIYALILREKYEEAYDLSSRLADLGGAYEKDRHAQRILVGNFRKELTLPLIEEAHKYSLEAARTGDPNFIQKHVIRIQNENFKCLPFPLAEELHFFKQKLDHLVPLTSRALFEKVHSIDVGQMTEHQEYILLTQEMKRNYLKFSLATVKYFDGGESKQQAIGMLQSLSGDFAPATVFLTAVRPLESLREAQRQLKAVRDAEIFREKRAKFKKAREEQMAASETARLRRVQRQKDETMRREAEGTAAELEEARARSVSDAEAAAREAARAVKKEEAEGMEASPVALPTLTLASEYLSEATGIVGSADPEEILRFFEEVAPRYEYLTPEIATFIYQIFPRPHAIIRKMNDELLGDFSKLQTLASSKHANIEFSDEACTQFSTILKENRNARAVLVQIYDAIENFETPLSGIGRPEQLKHKGDNVYSRRIDHANRLVYKQTAEKSEFIVYIISCDEHY
jgi:Txe/YoeB family toxin of toxin-antitoxin system